MEGAVCLATKASSSSLQQAFIEESDDFELAGYTSEDKLKLYITITKLQRDCRISKENLLYLLSNHIDVSKVTVGVIEDICRALKMRDVTKVELRKIAQGVAPRHGDPEKIELLVKPLRLRDTMVMSQSMIGKRLTYQNIAAGSLVARFYPATDGEDGVDVFGQPIVAQRGERGGIKFDDSLTLEESTEVAAVHKELIAFNDGYLSIEEGRYQIRNTLKIDDHLDKSYGDIDFIGFVSVQGDVMQDVSVKGVDGIHIEGSFRGKNLNSASGSIYISQNAFGSPDGCIMAGGTFTSTTVQEINTEIIGNIYIRREALNSVLRTASSVIMPQGTLVGGKVITCKGVEARVLGSEAGTLTVIELCSDLEASMEYSKLQVDLEILEKERVLLALRLGPYAQDRSLLLNLSPEQRQRLRDDAETIRSIDLKRTLLKEQIDSLRVRAKRAKEILVSFHECLHEGVEIRCGTAVFKSPQKIQGPATIQYLRASHQFLITEFRELA